MKVNRLIDDFLVVLFVLGSFYAVLFAFLQRIGG